MPASDKRRSYADVITPADVDRTNASVDRPEWRDAEALLAPYARGAGDQSGDVASLARLLIAGLLDKGHGPSDAARIAVSTARRSWGQVIAQQSALEAVSLDAGEDNDPREALAQTLYPAPDRIARWTMRDTLASVASVLDESQRAVAGALWQSDECWTNTGRPNVAALARALYPDQERVPTGRARAALATVVAGTLAAMPGYAADTLAVIDLPSSAPERERGLLRDTSTPDAGPASYVVLTRPEGQRWLLLADRSTRVTDDGASAALAVITQAAWHGTRPASEELSATLTGPSPLLPTRHPAGVQAGLRYGPHGAVSSDGAYADTRPVTSTRKRKRDGGIGTSAVTGRTALGQGRRGTPDDAGSRVTAADALAHRLAAMTDAERDAYERAAERAVIAGHALHALDARSGMAGKGIGYAATATRPDAGESDRLAALRAERVAAERAERERVAAERDAAWLASPERAALRARIAARIAARKAAERKAAATA